MGMRRAGQITEAHHRQIFRHPQATTGSLGQHALGQGIGAAYHHLAGAAGLYQASEPCASHR
ncbi:hypothetical protein D3C85_1389580 [compost metagenome]